MPQPYERDDVVGRLRVIKPAKHAHYLCKCVKCRRFVTVSARELHLKREAVNCVHCQPPRPQPKPALLRGRNGWLEVQEAA